MRGASITDLQWMLNFDVLMNKVYYYDHVGMSAVPVSMMSKGSIPWPVVWLVARYHKRHVFASKRLPLLGTVRDSINNFEK
jgi:hypothetical protein